MQQPTVSAGLLAAPATNNAIAADLAPAEPSRGHWSSQQLLAGRREISITHGESIYRLRLTSLGKLILTK